MTNQAKGQFYCDPVKCPHCGNTLEPVTTNYSADRISEWKKDKDGKWMIRTAGDGKHTSFTAIVCRDCLKEIGVIPYTLPE